MKQQRCLQRLWHAFKIDLYSLSEFQTVFKLVSKSYLLECLLGFLPSGSRYVLDEYGSCRRANLVGLFIDALTKGGPGGALKPIEMHANDPKRYVGDMLAWLHQTIPSERESLIALLKACSKTGMYECMILIIFIFW